jgi:hypothetical protein
MIKEISPFKGPEISLQCSKQPHPSTKFRANLLQSTASYVNSIRTTFSPMFLYYFLYFVYPTCTTHLIILGLINKLMWFRMLVVDIFMQFSRDFPQLISVRNKYYFQLYVTKYSSLLLILQHATNKFENMYVPGFTPTRNL